MHNVRIVARNKAHNLPSRRIFEKLGFHTMGDDKELLLCAKDLSTRPIAIAIFFRCIRRPGADASVLGLATSSLGVVLKGLF
jgi:L-amino acid N-acyltransferase YncA